MKSRYIFTPDIVGVNMDVNGWVSTDTLFFPTCIASIPFLSNGELARMVEDLRLGDDVDGVDGSGAPDSPHHRVARAIKMRLLLIQPYMRTWHQVSHLLFAR